MWGYPKPWTFKGCCAPLPRGFPDCVPNLYPLECACLSAQVSLRSTFVLRHTILSIHLLYTFIGYATHT